jgi:hypothetical protein
METLTPFAGGRTATAPAAAREANLQRAQQVRSARARVKRALAAGETTIASALTDPCCQTMRVADLLRCQPKWGRVRSAETLRALQIGERREVAGLTIRQRTLIVLASRRERAT